MSQDKSDTEGPTADAWSRVPAGAALVLVPAVAVLLSWHTLGDLDIWFHLRSGSELLAGAFHRVNHYSFTEAGRPWLNHEWLFQVVAAWLGPDAATDPVRVTGWSLLRTALAATLALLLVLGDGGWTNIRGRGARAAWRAPFLLAALGLLWPRLTMRPELVSYIGLVLVVRWLEVCLHGPADRRRLYDPRGAHGRILALTVVWTQFHGFAAVVPALVFSGLVWAAVADRRASERVRRLGLLTLGTIAALGLSPLGWRGLAYPVVALGQLGSETVDLSTVISELAPLSRTGAALGITKSLFLVSAVWGGLRVVLDFRGIGPLRSLLFVAAAAAAFQHQRSLGIYAVAFALLHTRGPFLPVLRAARIPSAVMRSGGAAATLIAVAAAAIWIPAIVDDRFPLREGVGRRFGDGPAPATLVPEAAEILRRNPDWRTFANLECAAYLLASTPVTLFIDGRTEAYSPEIWAEYLAVKAADDRSLSLLDTRRVDAVCLGLGGRAFEPLARRLLDSGRWQLASAEPGGLLFRRHHSPPGPASAQTRIDANGETLLAAAERALDRLEPAAGARYADGLLAVARLQELAGESGAALATLERGAHTRVAHPVLLHNLGNARLATGDAAGALEAFTRAFAANPRASATALNAGVSAMRLQRPDAAVTWFERTVGLNDEGVAGWANLAAALRAAGRPAEALSALERALTLAPADRRLRARRDAWAAEDGRRTF